MGEVAGRGHKAKRAQWGEGGRGGLVVGSEQHRLLIPVVKYKG